MLQRTDTAVSFEPLPLLWNSTRTRVISADTFRKGVVITFEDGMLFSRQIFCNGTFAQTEELKEMDSVEPISSNST